MWGPLRRSCCSLLSECTGWDPLLPRSLQGPTDPLTLRSVGVCAVTLRSVGVCAGAQNGEELFVPSGQKVQTREPRGCCWLMMTPLFDSGPASGLQVQSQADRLVHVVTLACRPA